MDKEVLEILKSMQSDIKSLKSMQSDMNTMQSDMKSMHEDIKLMQSGMNSMQEDIKFIKVTQVVKNSTLSLLLLISFSICILAFSYNLLIVSK